MWFHRCKREGNLEEVEEEKEEDEHACDRGASATGTVVGSVERLADAMDLTLVSSTASLGLAHRSQILSLGYSNPPLTATHIHPSFKDLNLPSFTPSLLASSIVAGVPLSLPILAHPQAHRD